MEEVPLNTEFLNAVKFLEGIKATIKENSHLKYLLVVLDALIALINERNPQYRSIVSSHFSAIRHCIRFYLGKCELSESLSPFILKSEKNDSHEPKAQRDGSALNHLDDYVEQEKRMLKEQEYLDDLSTGHQENALKKFLFDCWAQLIYNKRSSKKFFISYAWPKPHDDFQDEAHVISYLLKWAEHLIQSGMQVCIDQFHSGAGKSLGKFMGKINEIVLPECEAYEVEHVFVVSTRTLPGKLSNSYSGCSCEHKNMRERIEKERSHRFVIPILLNRRNYLPETFKKIAAINFCTTPYLENFKELFRVTHSLGKSFIEFCDERIGAYGLSLDVYIANGLKEKYTSPDVANIQFLTYTNSTPLSDGFVNLAVVREEEYQEMERLLQKKGVEVPQEKPISPIQLDKIWTSDVGHTIIEGPAGIGKSTLMRYFANQWAQKTTTYDALILLPLRRLHEYNEAIDLKTFVYRECISVNYQTKLSKDMIQQYLLNNKKISILYLLDGLDEVSSLLVNSCHKKLLESLLQKENWVLTSRPPYQIDKARFGACRHLQNIGFQERDIEKYVKRFFGNQEKKVSVVMRMLENNANIRSIANVPINLEFICTVVQSEDELSQEDTVNMTVTKLYEKVLVLLLKRYLLRLKELKILDAKVNVLNLTSRRTLNHPNCQAPLKFLRKLAWLALQHKSPVISSKTIQDVFDEFFMDSEIDQDVDNIFKHLFILKPTGQAKTSALDQSYYFVHLTFQEFFAAQYVFNGLLDEASLSVDIKEIDLIMKPINKKLIVQEVQILQFLAEMLEDDETRIQRLQEIVLFSRPDLFGKKGSIASSNAITILNAANVSLHNRDFSGVDVSSANLFGAMLWGSNCSKADFTGVNFAGACLQGVDFSGTKMKGVNFGEWPNIQLGHKFSTCAFSRDGKYLALAVENVIEIYASDTGKLITRLKGHSKTVSCLAFDNSGKQLASGGQRAEVVVWDVASGKVVQCFSGHVARISCIAFDSTGEKLATGSLDNAVIIWDIKNSRKLCDLKGHRDAVRCLAFYPNSNQLILGGDDGSLRLWDIFAGNEEKCIQKHTSEITSLALDPNFKKLASASKNGSILLWDLNNNLEEFAYLKGHEGCVRSVAFDSKGEKLVSSGDDGTLRLWGAFTKTELQVYRGHTDSVSNVAFQSESQKLVSVDIIGCVRFWSLQNNRNPKLPSSTPGKSRAIAVNAKNKIVASAENNAVTLWDLSTGKAIQKISKSMGRINSLEFDLSGEILAFANNKVITIVEKSSSKELQHFERDSSWVENVLFDLDAKKMFLACKDNTARLWDTHKKEEIFCVRTHSKSIGIAMNTKNKRFAYVDEASFIAVRNTKAEVTRLECVGDNKPQLTCMHFDSSAEKLIAGDIDGTIWVWDIVASHLFLCLSSHTSKITQALFNPQGDKFLIVLMEQLHFYDLLTGKCLLTLEFNDSISALVWEKVEDENVILISYGKNMVCYTDHAHQNNFSVTLKWVTTEKKLVLKNIKTNDVCVLDQINRLLIEQQEKSNHQTESVPQKTEEITADQAVNEAIISSAQPTKPAEPFYTVSTGEGYQPVILVYDVLNEVELIAVLNKFKCLRKKEGLLSWDWYWQMECEDINFASIDSYAKNPQCPELLGLFSMVNSRCYLMLPSVRRACEAVKFFHKSFESTATARPHGALYVNKLFSVDGPYSHDFTNLLDHFDPELDSKKRNERYENVQDEISNTLAPKDVLSLLSQYTKDESAKPLIAVEYYKFEFTADSDPEAVYLGFHIFMRGRELTVIRNWFGEVAYTLADAADETMEHVFASQINEERLVEPLHQEVVVVTDKEGNSPLHLIAKSGDLSTLEQVIFSLMEKDDLVEVVNKKNKSGSTALHLAAQNGFKDLCALLLDFGAALDVYDDTEEMSPLQWAIWRGRDEVVEFLIDRGASVETKNEKTATGIQLAASGGHVSLVKKFIQKYRADPKQKNEFGRSALHIAAREGHADVVLLLLESDHVLDDQDIEFGNTPLHYAAAEGHIEVVNILLAMGASRSIENNAKQTPQQLAAVRERIDIFEIFCGTTDVNITIQLYQMRLQLNPVSSTDHHKLARYYSIKAQQEPENAETLLLQAENHFVTALQFPVCSTVIFTEYGNFLIQRSRVPEAVQQLLRVVQLESDQQTLTYDLLERFLVEKDLQEQIVFQNKITMSNRLYAVRLLMMSYLQSGKKNEAELLLPLLYRLTYRNRNRISYFLLSWTLHALSKFDEAKKYLHYAESSHADSELELEIIQPLLNSLVIRMEAFSPSQERSDAMVQSMMPFGQFKSGALDQKIFMTNATGDAYLPIMVVYTVLDSERLIAIFDGLKCCTRKGQSFKWSWLWSEECEELNFARIDSFTQDKKRPLLLGEFSILDNVLYLVFPSFTRAAIAVEFLENFLEAIAEPNYILLVKNVFGLDDNVSREYANYYLRYISGEALPDSISHYMHNTLGINLSILLRCCEVVVMKKWEGVRVLNLDEFFSISYAFTEINMAINNVYTFLSKFRETVNSDLSKKTSREIIAHYEEQLMLVLQINNQVTDVEKKLSDLNKSRKALNYFSGLGDGLLNKLGPKVAEFSGVAALLIAHRPFQNLACARFSVGVDESDELMLKEAEATFQQAVALEENSSVCTDYAVFLLKNERYSDAILNLNKAIKTNTIENELGYMKRDRNTLPQEIQLLIDAHGTVEVNAGIFAYYLLGICYTALNQTELFLTLLTDFEKKVVEFPDYVHYLLCGYACRSYGLNDKAAFYFDCAEKLKPVDSNAKSYSPTESLRASKTSFWDESKQVEEEVDEDLKLALELSLQSSPSVMRNTE